MSVRRTITMLTVPLFLALALVNGALLYFQEKAEMSQALSEQALAAAITAAEFISSMDNPRAELAKPLRASALQAAARHIPGLDGVYLILPGTDAQALVAPARPWRLETPERPERAHALPVTESGEQHYVVALAPVAAGGFVAARIDAEPMFARLDEIRRIIVLVVLAAGVIAALLAWFVARRIVNELDKNFRMITTIIEGEPMPDDRDLKIREVRDLAGAVRLIDASGKAAAERGRRVTARKDRERTVSTALAAVRDAEFAPTARSLAGNDVAVRICGDAPPGAFFALGADGTQGMVVLGRCSGASPQEAFAHAAAARRFLEANMFAMPAGDCLARATDEHKIEDIRVSEWGAATPSSPRLLMLSDPDVADRAAAYADGNPDAEAAELLAGIELLLEPSGIFAAISRR